MRSAFHIVFCIPFFSFHLFCQGTWTQKADMITIPREGAVGFSIGTNGYVCTGANSADCWKWDSQSNIWTQKANITGYRTYATGFSIGAYGYVGTGSASSGKKDFWKYDTTSNVWTQIADFAGGIRFNAVGFSIGNFGYVGTGDSAGRYKKDFWQYNTVNNAWTQKTNFGGSPRYGAVGFSIDSLGYIGTGWDTTVAGGPTNDFWAYSPATNSWKQKTNFGGAARYLAVGFSIGSYGYMGTGFATYGDFWQYNPIIDSWIQIANFGGGGRNSSASFSIGNKGYVAAGNDQSNGHWDLWEFAPTPLYIPEQHASIKISLFPNPFSEQTELQVFNSELQVKELQIKIYDVYGKEVCPSLIRTSSSFVINREGLSSGIYFYQITNGSYKKCLATGKLIIN